MFLHFETFEFDIFDFDVERNIWIFTCHMLYEFLLFSQISKFHFPPKKNQQSFKTRQREKVIDFDFDVPFAKWNHHHIIEKENNTAEHKVCVYVRERDARGVTADGKIGQFQCSFFIALHP